MDRRAEMNKRKMNRKSLLTFYFFEDTPLKKQGLPVEKGFAIPLMSAFRVLLEETQDGYRWQQNPFRFFDSHGTEMVKRSHGGE